MEHDGTLLRNEIKVTNVAGIGGVDELLACRIDVTKWLDFKRAGAKEVQLRPHPYEFYLYSEL